MLSKFFLSVAFTALILLGHSSLWAGGISADAGLTPAQDKWILRTQLRYMQRGDDPSPMKREMESFMFPLVVAYGLRPELTVMMRQPFASMDMTMNNLTTNNSGFGDLMVMFKYKAYRYNTRVTTFGAAPLVGIKIPTGEKPFTSDATDLKTGLYFSGRKGAWASDLNLSFTFNGIIGPSNLARNRVFDVVFAAAHQIDLGHNGRDALAPVLEFSYTSVTAGKIDGVKQANSGESFIRLSPGLKYTRSSIIFEALAQIPVWQDQTGIQPELGVGALFGIRIFM